MRGGYPIGAFALALILFTADMKQAFISGILVILAAVSASLLKDILQGRVPQWSLCTCVYLWAAGICVGSFHAAYYISGIENPIDMRILEGLAGILCAKEVLGHQEITDYNRILAETSVAWAVLITAGMFREFMMYGSIYENRFGSFSFLGRNFGGLPVGIIVAGIGLGCINRALHTDGTAAGALPFILPVLILYPPVTVSRAAGLVLLFIFYWSVLKKIKFSCVPSGFHQTPAQLISAGLICMLLSDLAFTIR